MCVRDFVVDVNSGNPSEFDGLKIEKKPLRGFTDEFLEGFQAFVQGLSELFKLAFIGCDQKMHHISFNESVGVLDRW